MRVTNIKSQKVTTYTVYIEGFYGQHDWPEWLRGIVGGLA